MSVIEEILRHEGGFSDRQADKGGPTNMGITMPTLAAWRGRPVTRQDIINLTREEAEAIYRDRYVKPWEFIDDGPLRDVLVDWGVTSGLDDPTKALQSYINSVGMITVQVDGVLGPKTREAWATTRTTIHGPGDWDSAVASEIAKKRLRFYVRLGLSDQSTKDFMSSHPRSQLHNLAGWVNRALEFL